MKVNAKFKDYSFDKDNNIVVSFTVDRRFIERVQELEQTHDNKYLELKTSDRVAQKSERQNSAVWQLIRMINEKQDGKQTEENKLSLYAQLIKLANIKVSYVQGLEAMHDELSKLYRVVLIREKRMAVSGVETCMFELYRGLSQFDKEETTRFIETILEYSDDLGLGINLESDYLRSLIKEN